MNESPIAVAPDEEEEFMQKRMEEYEQLILKIQTQEGCSRGKARRIIKSRSKKILKQYNKSVARNMNKPKIDVSDITPTDECQ